MKTAILFLVYGTASALFGSILGLCGLYILHYAA